MIKNDSYFFKENTPSGDRIIHSFWRQRAGLNPYYSYIEAAKRDFRDDVSLGRFMVYKRLLSPVRGTSSSSSSSQSCSPWPYINGYKSRHNKCSIPKLYNRMQNSWDNLQNWYTVIENQPFRSGNPLSLKEMITSGKLVWAASVFLKKTVVIKV